jgi:hypothetical protein
MRIRHIFLTYATIVLLCVLFHVFGSATAPHQPLPLLSPCARLDGDCAGCLATDNCFWCTQIALHSNGSLRSVSGSCLRNGSACADAPNAGIKAAINLCPRTGDLPCFNRALGDVCAVNEAFDERLPHNGNLSAGVAGVVQQQQAVLTGGIGVRTDLPPLACAILPEFLPAMRAGASARVAIAPHLPHLPRAIVRLPLRRRLTRSASRPPRASARSYLTRSAPRCPPTIAVCAKRTPIDASLCRLIVACRHLDLYNLSTIACPDACAPPAAARHESAALVQLRPTAPVCALAGTVAGLPHAALLSVGAQQRPAVRACADAATRV